MTRAAPAPSFLFPPKRRINVRREIRKRSPSPIQPFINRLALTPTTDAVGAAAARFHADYSLYLLALERTLRLAAVETAYRHGPHYSRKYHVKFTASEAKLARRRALLARFGDLDFYSVIMFSRALLDDVAGLSASFLMRERTTPSFRSFARQKRFFLELSTGYGRHEGYAAYIRSRTDWFDVLKRVRDDFVVHPQASFLRFGLVGDKGRSDVGALFVPRKSTVRPDGSLSEVGLTTVGLSDAIDTFLEWFGEYALTSIGESTPGVV